MTCADTHSNLFAEIQCYDEVQTVEGWHTKIGISSKCTTILDFNEQWAKTFYLYGEIMQKICYYSALRHMLCLLSLFSLA